MTRLAYRLATTLAIIMQAVAPAAAADVTVTMSKVTRIGTGEAIGTINVTDSEAGALFKLALHGLPPGPHGFHVHLNPDCDPTMTNGILIPGGSAGGHWDPDMTDKHEGPEGQGHLGDLPELQAAADGTATQTLTAPRLKDITPLKNHALVIQAGGDTYKDEPQPNGGGGPRIACGVIR